MPLRADQGPALHRFRRSDDGTDDFNHALIRRSVLYCDAYAAIAQMLAHRGGVADKKTVGAAAQRDRCSIRPAGWQMTQQEICDSGKHVPAEFLQGASECLPRD